MTDTTGADTASALDDAFSHAPQPAVATPPPNEPQAETPAEAQEPPPGQQADPGRPRRSMLDDLREERAKRQATEAQLVEFRREADEREKRYFESLNRTPRPQEQARPQRPDLFEDPNGALDFVSQSVEQRMVDRIVAMSEAAARRHHGNEKVDAALKAAKTAGIAQQFQCEADPFGSLLDWHGKMSTLQTIGSDVDAWRKSERDKMKAEIMEEMRKGGGQFRGPNEPRFPSTLADGTAAGAQGAHLSEQGAMDDVFRRR